MAADTLRLFSIGIGAISSLSGGIAQWKMGTAQQKAYEYNAEIALQKMRSEMERSRQEFTRLMGRQRILYAKAGVDLTSGSPLLVLMDTAYKQAQESERIRTEGEEESALQKYNGRIAAYSGRVKGISTFLTGLGRAATQVYEMKKGV